MIPFAPLIAPYRTVVLADGDFPAHPAALALLRDAERLVCCDGAAKTLTDNGQEPNYIVGDMDSLPANLQLRYKHCIRRDPDQTTNDLSKAVHFCVQQQWTEITVLGATGKREDHTIANIALSVAYVKQAKVQLITNHGIFVPILQTTTFESVEKQQVSVFSLTPATIFTFRGVKYPLTSSPLPCWWQGTLNEACGREFTVEMNEGAAIVFREHC
jgi:thiamine pyrophosphokinase